MATSGPKPRPLAERFWSKVTKTPTCWLWTAVTSAGYGTIWVREIQGYEFAHRVSWRLAGRLLTPGLQLDHLCRTPICVNPDHLQEVSARTNTLRGIGPTAINARKTHCIHGHEFSAANTVWRSNGQRKCRACRTRHSREQHQRRRLKEAA